MSFFKKILKSAGDLIVGPADPIRFAEGSAEITGAVVNEVMGDPIGSAEKIAANQQAEADRVRKEATLAKEQEAGVLASRVLANEESGRRRRRRTGSASSILTESSNAAIPS